MAECKCRVCEKMFWAHSWNARICSDECRKVFERERNNAAYYKNKNKVIVPVEEREYECKICNEKFKPLHATSKFCSYECRKEAERRRNKKYKVDREQTA